MIRLAASYMFIVYGMHMHVPGVDGVVFPCSDPACPLPFFTVPDCTPDTCPSSCTLSFPSPFPFFFFYFYPPTHRRSL